MVWPERVRHVHGAERRSATTVPVRRNDSQESCASTGRDRYPSWRSRSSVVARLLSAVSNRTGSDLMRAQSISLSWIL